GESTREFDELGRRTGVQSIFVRDREFANGHQREGKWVAGKRAVMVQNMDLRSSCILFKSFLLNSTAESCPRALSFWSSAATSMSWAMSRPAATGSSMQGMLNPRISTERRSI